MKTKEATAPKAQAKELIRDTRSARRYIARLRKLGASNFEIAKALGIAEDDPKLETT